MTSFTWLTKLGITEGKRRGWQDEMVRHHWLNGQECEQTQGGQWWTEKPGVLHFMGSQRVGHDLATEQPSQYFTSPLSLGRSKCPKCPKHPSHIRLFVSIFILQISREKKFLLATFLWLPKVDSSFSLSQRLVILNAVFVKTGSYLYSSMD